MKAVQLIAHGAPGQLELREIPDLKAAADEVIVRVRACGLNRLDLWLEEGALPVPVTLPRTPGGEVAGEVLSCGSEVTEWQAGERVAVQSNIFCGKCEFCARGRESLCLHSRLLGVQLDGGFAEQVAVPARALVRLPEGADFAVSAALTLAGSTAMHMLTDRANVCSGDRVLVVGAGSGVGSAAIQIARELGATVIATGSSEPKRRFALKLGAHHVVDNTKADWPAEVRRLTGKRGVDWVVEHVGGEVLGQCFECLARGGAVVTCGATAGREVGLKLWPLFVKEQKLIGSYGRNRKDMVKTLEWAVAGRIKATINRTYTLGETKEAFAALRGRQVIGKLVVLA